MSKPILAISMGDPCGIGPEIIADALADETIYHGSVPVIVGDRAAMERAVVLVGRGQRLRTIPERTAPENPVCGEIYVWEQSQLAPADMIYGRPTPAAGDAVFRYITAAAALCMAGVAAAMVTGPINKAALNMAGHHYPGHTELLAELTGSKQFVMMLAGPQLRVALVTIHEALADVPRLVTFDRVLSTIVTTHKDVARYFTPRPKIAVLSLNPHAGEEGMFGDHEAAIISPAILAAREIGIDASGPYPADTLFHFATQGDYDAVICMYHDQGLIPLKLLHFDDGVNITLGLPIIRTSVDHGTAYNLAGSGTASSASMKAAILTASAMAVSASA